MIVFKWNPMTGLMDMVDRFVGGILTKLLTLSKEGVQFDTSGAAPTGTPPEGSVWWNNDDHTLNIQSDIAGTINQVGQENWLRAYNNTGASIEEGSVVYINGANTARPTIAKAIATVAAMSDKVIGVVTNTVANGHLGIVTTFGLVRGIATNVDGDGQTLADGDCVFLSATTAGEWVKTKPHAPNHCVKIGQIVNAGPGGSGNIFVNVHTGTHLQDLHDVNVETSLANNDILIYDSVSGIWKNKTQASGLGGTFVQKSGDTMTGDLTLDNASFIVPGQTGYGIKMDTGAATYGWADLIGPIVPRTAGATAPSFNVFRGGLRQYQFSINDEEYVDFHIPHDYAPGTDMYLHIHWSHNSTTVTSGSTTWGFEVSYAKGHNQAAFSAPISASVTQTASTTQYRHMIAEIQLTAASPNANQLASSLIETDGLLFVRTFLSANTMTGTPAPEPFLLFVDLHYQTKTVGTKNKAPNFYTT